MALARRRFLGGALLSSVALSGVPGWAAGGLPPRKPSKLTVRQIHSGHSLTDTYMSWPWPGRLVLATQTQVPGQVDDEIIAKSTIPGSPLHWRWSHSSGDIDAKRDIDRYELLVITEGGPLSVDDWTFREVTLQSMDLWIENTWTRGNGGKGAEMMLYSFWVQLDTPGGNTGEGYEALPFRERLEVQGKLWERLQDYANDNRPAGMPAIYMIPGHRLVMRIYDDIKAGKVPGITAIDALFEDDIHMNAIGNYAVTMLVYAVIYQRNPKELPDRLAEEDRVMTSAQARYFKDVAWKVARSYGRAGLPG